MGLGRVPNIKGTAHGRSYICERYELRITKRCIEDDLSERFDYEFAELVPRYEIVKSFVDRRCDKPEDAKTVNGLRSGMNPVYRLSFGDDHRGATWYEPEHDVVWLLAYNRHRSKDADDAFKVFPQLDAAGVLRPTADDYEALFRDRDARELFDIRMQTKSIFDAARAAPGKETRGVVAHYAIAAIVDEDYPEMLQVLMPYDLPRRIFNAVLAGFAPTRRPEEWSLAATPTTYRSETGVNCFEILLEP